MATNTQIGPQPNLNLSSVGVGGNTAQSSYQLPGVHSGSWFGLPDLGVTETLKGQPAYQAPSMNFNLTQGQLNSPQTNQTNSQGADLNAAIAKYKAQGWNDDNAIKADIAAKGGAGAVLGGGGGQSSNQNNVNLGGKSGSYTAGDKNSFQSMLQGLGVNSDYGNYSEFLNPEQYLNEINNSYGTTQNLLGQAEGQANTEKQSALELAQKAYEASVGSLGATKQSQLGQIGQNITATQNRKQSAQDEAAQMYNEMIGGARQKFGGGSSAGEAAQALLGQQMQRQIGTTQKDFNSTMSQIEQQKVDLETNYSSALQQLDVQKQQSLNDIMSSFNQRIQAINQSRATSEENKAQARLVVLQNLRSQAMQIQQQQDVFKQNIQSMYMQQQMGLETYAKQLAMSGQNTASSFANLNKSIQTPTMQFTTPTASNMTLGQPGSVTQSVGSINTGNKAKDFLSKYGY